jgi:hypothetical protein
VTPKKKMHEEPGTPSSTLRGLATPAFLRRDNVLGAIDEADEATPRPAPWKRRGLGRSLSAMIQAMKKDEDDRLDEEADIMRELEMEEQGIVIPKKPKIPEIQVADSQAPMPLGPDRGLESDVEEEEEPELGPDGQPRRVWKKKGLKRQTRRVISKFSTLNLILLANSISVRPNLAKPKPQPTFNFQDDSDEGEDNATRTYNEDDDENSDYASDVSHTPKERRAKTKVGEKQDASKEGIIKAAGRKVKATAHANYRKLKIKSSKGSAGAKGRFGRRR